MAKKESKKKEKVAKAVKDKAKGLKLQAKFLMISILPLIVLAIAVVIISGFRVETVVQEEVHKGLEGTAVAMNNSLHMINKSEFRLLPSGHLTKGNTDLSEKTDLVDNIYAESGIHVTIFYGDTRKLTSIIDENGERLIDTQASETVVEYVLDNGEIYLTDSADVLGEKYYACYMPLYHNERDADNGKAPVGMVFAGISAETVQAEISQVMIGIVAIAAVCVAVAVVLISIVVKRVLKAIESGIGLLTGMAEGNLTLSFDEKLTNRPDEIGNMCRSLVQLKGKLVDAIRGVKEEAGDLRNTSDVMNQRMMETSNNVSQVEKAVEEIATGANSQAEETQKATENVIFMGNMVEDTKGQVEDLLANGEQMMVDGQEAARILRELDGINMKAKSSIDVIYEQTNTTNVSAMKIREAIDLITAIAEETNLLSLNASIEAARAGEQGRGFAVVAAQIQKLAEQSNDSARQIEEVIISLIADSEKAVETMDSVKEIMEEQSANVDKTDKIFKKVMDGINKASRGIEQIAVSTEQLDESRKVVIDTVQNLTAIAEENAASTEETSASTSEVGNAVADISEQSNKVATISDSIKAGLDYFKV